MEVVKKKEQVIACSFNPLTINLKLDPVLVNTRYLHPQEFLGPGPLLYDFCLPSDDTLRSRDYND